LFIHHLYYNSTFSFLLQGEPPGRGALQDAPLHGYNDPWDFPSQT
jgi:hypothetical protein